MQFPRWMTTGIIAVTAKIVLASIIVGVYVTYLNSQVGGAMTPPEMEAAAERIGTRTGIATGLLASFVGAWWATRRRGEHAVRNGLFVGLVMAALEFLIDAVRLDLNGDWLLSAVANIGGAIAGVMAARLTDKRPITYS